MNNLKKSLFLMTVILIMIFLQQLSAQVKISEIYGGGGNSGSFFKNDFIELYNPTDSVISLDGWSVQYAAASATGTWKITYLLKSIQPHGFYLIQENAGSGGTADLPLPDVAGTINISASSGKIALCHSFATLVGAAPADSAIIDLVGFGPSNFYEGSGPAAAPSNVYSIERKATSASTAESMSVSGSEELIGNSYDSNDNNSDFIVRTPDPQNSASPAEWLFADIQPPVIDSIRVLTDTQMVIYFNEAVDSVSSSDCSNYFLNKTVAIEAHRDILYNDRVFLTVQMLGNDFYTLTVQNIKDISGNKMKSAMSFHFAHGILTISQARLAEIGSWIRIHGIVTLTLSSKSLSFIQDSTAGIAVKSTFFSTLAHEGDLWQMTGRLININGMVCIDSIADTICVGKENPIPSARTIHADQAAEFCEGQLVKINGVSFSESGFFAGDSTGIIYHISDNTARLDVKISDETDLPGATIPAGILNLTGVIGKYYSHYQIIPRSKADIEQLSGPVFNSQPVITEITENSFSVSWNTEEAGHSYIAFGSTPVFDDSIASPISALRNSHTITVTGRKPGRIYYFRAASINENGTSYSPVYSVVTTSPQSSGQILEYFNYPIDKSLGLEPEANGSTDLKSKLLERISHAAGSIDIALYSFDDFNYSLEPVANIIADSLIAAKDRGVSIRVVFDNKETSPALSKLIAAGIPVQKRNIFGNSGIMHNKFFIFDGRDTTNALDDWVMSGSWNVTDIGTYKDAQNVIYIQDQSLARIYTLEFEEMFGSGGETPNPDQARYGAAKLDNTPHFTMINGIKVEVYFSPSDQSNLRIIQALSSADKNIFFGQFAFTRDDIQKQIVICKNTGVIVKGIIEEQSDSLSYLNSAGIDVVLAGHSVVTGLFHHKYGIVDPFNNESDPLVITGSHNWSTSAETDNDENVLIIHSGDIARQYVQEFSERYKESGGSGSITGVEKRKNVIPSIFKLEQNYPNPFNPVTVIKYSLPVKSNVVLKIYDLLGREVEVLEDEVKPAGSYSVRWDAQHYASGVYFYHLTAGKFTSTKKLLLIK